ncbi:MAG: topoisomerase DNA-binding C4 zinc finger domain-containing protein, partial [archaeon]|nr:topoisomerase DNA-binding C4 zinc finger domain-containing protein [archaeon]
EKNIFLRKRNEILLDIIEDIYKTYQKFLDKREDLDFNDMINNASKSIQEMGFSKSYKYIIVDEYQDVSYTRYQLLKTIQDELKCKIIVVGDDWQSIFKFSGCDVSLFSNFSDYFPNPKVMRIESTYRNTQDLIDVSGKFIMKNPNQVKKSLYSKAYPQIHNPIQIYEYGENSQEVYALEQIVKDIISHCPEDVNILILGRNRHDIYPFLYEKKSKEEIEIPKIFKSASNTKIKFLNREFDKDKCVKIKYLKNPKVNITYRTIHSSKGLEEDNVILINLKNKNSGFPNQREDDPILKYVIRNKENFSFAEERRLFYVALTRTKNHTYLLSPKNKKSIFVREIEKDNYNLIVHDFGSKEWSPNKNETRKIPTKLKCPICITGDITLIVTKKSSFFACSHQQCHFETTFFKGSLEDLDDIEYCPLCGSVVYKVRSENGNVYKCSNNDCKFIKDDTSDSSYNFIETSLNCPDCGKKIHLKQNYKTEKSVFKCMDPICNWFGGYYDGELSNLHKVKQCPNCGGILKNKKGKYGSFLGCSNYPNCNYIEKLNRNNFGSNDYSKSSYNDSNHKEDSSKNGNSGNICPQCGKKLVKHNGKYGPFVGCSGFPKCKYVKNLEGNSFNSQNKNLNGEKKNSEKICPKCGSKLVKRFGKFGKFWGCSNYPKCKYTKNIK